MNLRQKTNSLPPKYNSIPYTPWFFHLTYYELLLLSLKEETNTNRQNTPGLSKLTRPKIIKTRSK